MEAVKGDERDPRSRARQDRVVIGNDRHSLSENAKQATSRRAQSDLGPIKYLTSLIGADPDQVVRWFILVVALLLDPLAVVLLLAATRDQP